MYEQVIVPVDLSHHDLEHRVMAVASRMVTEGGTIKLLHVIAPPSPSFTLVGLEDDETRGEAEKGVLKQLQEIASRNNLPANTEVCVEHGRPARVICDAITDVDNHAIVMTSHNPTYSDFLLGSVASQVVKHAEGSVFIIRHSALT